MEINIKASLEQVRNQLKVYKYRHDNGANQLPSTDVDAVFLIALSLCDHIENDSSAGKIDRLIREMISHGNVRFHIVNGIVSGLGAPGLLANIPRLAVENAIKRSPLQCSPTPPTRSTPSPARWARRPH